MSMDQENRVAEPAAVGDHDCQPTLERSRVGDVAGFDRPLDAAGVGEGADGIGRRQPRHQPVELGRLEPFFFPVILRCPRLRGPSQVGCSRLAHL